MDFVKIDKKYYEEHRAKAIVLTKTEHVAWNILATAGYLALGIMLLGICFG